MLTMEALIGMLSWEQPQFDNLPFISLVLPLVFLYAMLGFNAFYLFSLLGRFD